MPENIAIQTNNLSKLYRLYNSPRDRLKEAIHPLRKKYHKDFYALNKISIKISKGQTIGIIGQNGSGKSTMLKILSSVLSPSSGEYSCSGKVSSLLELGGGFNQELSGLDNVYFNGAIQGITKKEMKQKLPEIIDFADIGEFIYQPVKSYSSGMYVRLAFAVAINIDPEILVIDEALSVGDLRFQQKCYRKIREFKDSDKTILFCSHDLSAVKNFCDRVIWLDKGTVKDYGETDYVCDQYHSFMSYNSEAKTTIVNSGPGNNGIESAKSEIHWDDISHCLSFGEGGAKITGIVLRDKKNSSRLEYIEGGEKVKVFVKIESFADLTHPGIGILLNDKLGNPVFTINNYIFGVPIFLKKDSTNTLMIEFEFPKITAGNYTMSVSVFEGNQQEHVQHHWIHDALLISVNNSDLKYNLGSQLVIDKARIVNIDH